MFGDGEDLHGMEMSLWPEDMEVVNGLLQWRVNIVRFSPLVSSNYRTPVRPDGFITGIGKVSATFVLNQDGTCTSVLSLAGVPKATIQIACTNGPGLMFRVLRPPRQTRWIVINAVYRETEGLPTVVREYLADMRTGDVWLVSDFTTEGFVVEECDSEAKVLWNSDSARRLGLRVSQCLNTVLWPSDNDRLARLRQTRPVQETVVRAQEQSGQSPTPEENAAWMAGYRDAFRGGEVTMTTKALARERNYPTSDGTRVLRQLQAGTTISGRWVLGRDTTSRWLRRSGTGGYVWEGNLAEGQLAASGEALVIARRDALVAKLRKIGTYTKILDLVDEVSLYKDFADLIEAAQAIGDINRSIALLEQSDDIRLVLKADGLRQIRDGKFGSDLKLGATKLFGNLLIDGVYERQRESGLTNTIPQPVAHALFDVTMNGLRAAGGDVPGALISQSQDTVMQIARAYVAYTELDAAGDDLVNTVQSGSLIQLRLLRSSPGNPRAIEIVRQFINTTDTMSREFAKGYTWRTKVDAAGKIDIAMYLLRVKAEQLSGQPFGMSVGNRKANCRNL